MSSNQAFALYVHIPWCIQKCPYCDFNSHRLTAAVDWQQYLQCLLGDWQQELKFFSERLLTSIFIGGGTPSLMPAEFYDKLLTQIKNTTHYSSGMEVTLEANPGTVDSANFAGFFQAGVNRLSIGVQSFNNRQLNLLGRIHDQQQVDLTFKKARLAGFDNINLDLMFALPEQNLQQAEVDLKKAIELGPEHISWYQLTLEPNTEFYRKPPAQMPDDDASWEIQQSGMQILSQAGVQHYEISAYAKATRQCAHNLNYWRFGDYAAIGAGAHAKTTLPDGRIMRRTKFRSPSQYQQGRFTSSEKRLDQEDIFIEFLMNRLRLREPFELASLLSLTGLSMEQVNKRFQKLIYRGLLELDGPVCQVTEKGHRYLNELLTELI